MIINHNFKLENIAQASQFKVEQNNFTPTTVCRTGVTTTKNKTMQSL